MTKTIQDLKVDFDKDIEILKKTQAEMNMELKKLNKSTRKFKGKTLEIQGIKQKIKYRTLR